MWRELLIGASDEPEEAYLLDLIKAASEKIGAPVKVRHLMRNSCTKMFHQSIQLLSMFLSISIEKLKVSERIRQRIGTSHAEVLERLPPILWLLHPPA